MIKEDKSMDNIDTNFNISLFIIFIKKRLLKLIFYLIKFIIYY